MRLKGADLVQLCGKSEIMSDSVQRVSETELRFIAGSLNMNMNDS